MTKDKIDVAGLTMLQRAKLLSVLTNSSEETGQIIKQAIEAGAEKEIDTKTLTMAERARLLEKSMATEGQPG